MAVTPSLVPGKGVEVGCSVCGVSGLCNPFELSPVSSVPKARSYVSPSLKGFWLSRGCYCAFSTSEAKGFVSVGVITLTESADQSRFFLGLIAIVLLRRPIASLTIPSWIRSRWGEACDAKRRHGNIRCATAPWAWFVSIRATSWCDDHNAQDLLGFSD